MRHCDNFFLFLLPNLVLQPAEHCPVAILNANIIAKLTLFFYDITMIVDTTLLLFMSLTASALPPQLRLPRIFFTLFVNTQHR